jgi:hypothetical protein
VSELIKGLRWGKSGSVPVDSVRVWALRVLATQATHLLGSGMIGQDNVPDLQLVRRYVDARVRDTWLDKMPDPRGDQHPWLRFVVAAFDDQVTADEVRERHNARRLEGSNEPAVALEIVSGKDITRGAFSKGEIRDRLTISGVRACSREEAVLSARKGVALTLGTGYRGNGVTRQLDLWSETHSAGANLLPPGWRNPVSGRKDEEGGNPKGDLYRVWVTVYGETNARRVVDDLQQVRHGEDRWAIDGVGELSQCHDCRCRGHRAKDRVCWDKKFVVRVDSFWKFNEKVLLLFQEQTGASDAFSGVRPRHRGMNFYPKAFAHLVFDTQEEMAVGLLVLVRDFFKRGMLTTPPHIDPVRLGVPPCCSACGLLKSVADSHPVLESHDANEKTKCPASNLWSKEKRAEMVLVASGGGGAGVVWNPQRGGFWLSELCDSFDKLSVKQTSRRATRPRAPTVRRDAPAAADHGESAGVPRS